MFKRVMFTGAHGIGKSATAMKLNRLLPDYLYIPSFGGSVAKRMGFDLNRPHTVKDMIAYQERVLATFIQSFEATAFVHTIYDRSPNDIAAYMRAGLNTPELMRDYGGSYLSFERRCLEATRKYCSVLVYPDADFTEPMQNKPNRPTGEKYGREQFDRLLDELVGKVANDIKVIDVPKEYQYDARVRYIKERL